MQAFKTSAILIVSFLCSITIFRGATNHAFERAFHPKENEQNMPFSLNNSLIFPDFNLIDENTPPIAISSLNSDSIVLCLGDQIDWDISFIGPEEDQFISLEYEFNGIGLGVDYINSSNAEFHGLFFASIENVGVNEITIIATDNGEPELSTVLTFVFIVLNEVPPIVEISLTRNCNENLFILEATPNLDNYNWSADHFWSNHAISYIPGPVHLTVQDGSCHADTTIIIPEFSPSIPELSLVPMLCPTDTSTVCILNAELWETLTWDVTSQACGSYLFESEEMNCKTFSSDCSFYISLEGQGVNGCHLDSLIYVEYLAINSPTFATPFIVCDSLTEIALATPTLDEQAQLIITCFSHLYSGGWQGSYIVVQILCDEDGTIDEYLITSTGDLPEIYTFPIFPCMSVNILYYNSMTSEYTDEHFNVQFQNIEETFFLQDIDVFEVWSATADLETQTINFNWSASGPEGWLFSENNDNEAIFIPGNYGDFTIQLAYDICPNSYAYPLSVIHEPSIWFATDEDILLCASDSSLCINYSSYTNPDEIQWFLGFEEIQSADPCFTLGPFTWYTSNYVYATVQNECGQSADSVNFVSYPEISSEIFQIENTLIVSNCVCEFQWFLNGNAIVGANENQIEVSEDGNYSVLIANECAQILSEEITYLGLSSNSLISSEWPATMININGQLNLILKEDIEFNSIEIMDISGKKVFLLENAKSGHTYSTNITSSGAYLLFLKSNNTDSSARTIRFWNN